jgi:hypothetical protein
MASALWRVDRLKGACLPLVDLEEALPRLPKLAPTNNALVAK